MDAIPAPEPLMPPHAFDALFESVKNWGRWGADDERGALNYITPARVREAASLVRSGRTVSLSVPVNTAPAADNPLPAQHYMSMMTDVDTGGEPRWNQDYIGLDFHGYSQSHIDAICHCVYRGQIYNAIPGDSVTWRGGSRAAIEVAEHGIVGRGVLLDFPRLRGVKWLEPGTKVLPAELDAAERAQGVRVREGDILLLRVGHHRRRLELGAWPSWEAMAGLHHSAFPWLHARRVAALGNDGDGEAYPSAVAGVVAPNHVLAIAAMGLHLLDCLNLEELAAACAAEGRWEFQCVIAPLRLLHGTGSPVNPIAIL